MKMGYKIKDYIQKFGEVKQKHPLVNDDSKHYQMIDGIESIFIFEDMFSIEELMSWAKINSYKYRFRLGKKDDNNKDIKKMQTYENYYLYLKNILDLLKSL